MNRIQGHCTIFIFLQFWSFFWVNSSPANSPVTYFKPRLLKPRLPDTFKFKPQETEETGEKQPTRNIVGGSAAKYKMIPHQVLLELDGSYQCGGSLISPTWVLSAAHCARNMNRIQVTLGNIYPDMLREPYLWTTVSYVKIVHEKYDNSRFFNDIALIKLPTAAPLSSYIKPIDLPRSSDALQSFAGYMGTASGWGWSRDRSTSTDMLMYAKMEIISNAECNKTYGTKYMVESSICTSGAGPKSTCRGDSGGPLTVEIDGQKILVGATSFGLTSCQSGFPQVYTRITSYLQWISSKTGIVINP